MSLKAFWSFDHLPVGTSVGAAATQYGLAYGPPTLKITNATSPSIFLLPSGFVTGGNDSGTGPYLGFAIGDLWNPAAPRSWVGFRVRRTSTTTNGTSLIYYSGTGGTQTLLTRNNALFTTARDYFVEMVADKVNNQFVVYIDGVVAATLPQAAANLTTAANQIWLGCSTVNAIRDVYFLDDDGVGLTTRLGPVSTRLLAMNTLTVNDWVSSDGTTDPKTLMTPPYASTAAATAPYMQSQVTYKPMSFTLVNTNIQTYESVIAMGLLTSAQLMTASGNAPLKTTVNYNSVTSPAVNGIFPVGVFGYSYSNLLNEKAPDGTAWNKTSVGAATFTFTPATS